MRLGIEVNASRSLKSPFSPVSGETIKTVKSRSENSEKIFDFSKISDISFPVYPYFFASSTIFKGSFPDRTNPLAVSKALIFSTERINSESLSAYPLYMYLFALSRDCKIR